MSLFRIAVCSLLLPLSVIKMNAQEITSFAGTWSMEYYQDDKKITAKELKELFEKNQEVAQYWKQANTNAGIAGGAILLELGFAGWTGWRLGQDKNAAAPAIGTLGCAALAAIYMVKANKKKKKAILTYNKQFDKQASFRLVPTRNENGVGLALKF